MDRREDRAKQHSRALEIIAIQPEAFGFENTSDIALEITLPENGRAITETDIKLVMANGDLYLVEFKLSSANKYKRRARQQLEKARGWYTPAGQDRT